jgi:recombination protein RecT
MSRDIQNRNGAAPATRRGFLELLEVAKPQIAAIIPSGVNVDRAIQIARAAFLADPKIQACEAGSILRVVGQACQLGLELGGPKQEAYPVPYGQTCTLIVGYRGLAELARRSGKVLDIDADVVREGDTFRYGRNPLPYLEHTPALSQRGDVTHVYAVAILPGGLAKYAVLESHEVDAIRKRSRSGGSGPWASDWCEMAKKTAVRRLCKLLPMSAELAAAIDHDNETDGLVERAQQAPQQARPGVAERVMGRLSPPTQETQEDAPWSLDEPGADDDPEKGA